MSESEGAKGIDLGWNDPPMFTYDSRQVYTNVKKPSLTKRVGLSWDSSSPAPPIARSDEPILPASAPPRGPVPGPPPPSSSSKPPSSPSLISKPPPPSSDGLPPPPSAPPMEEEPEAKSPTTDTSESLGELTAKSSEINLDIVSKALNELAEELFGDKEREKSEINKRLSILDSLWSDDKFPVDIKEKLYRISEALKSGNVDEADKLQRGLMIDHSTLCSTWMAAVRKLIAAKRSDAGS
uniref:Steroid receptor RNA activator 1 n=1 Tax=Lygus hesperus TaxID=30085 RepID=A0A146KNS5_LYGHE